MYAIRLFHVRLKTQLKDSVCLLFLTFNHSWKNKWTEKNYLKNEFDLAGEATVSVVFRSLTALVRYFSLNEVLRK